MSYGRAGEVDRRDALEKGDSKELSPPLFPFPFPLLFMEMIEREKGTRFFSLSIFRHEFLSYSLDPFFRCLLVHSIFLRDDFRIFFLFSSFYTIYPIVWAVKEKRGSTTLFLDKSLFMIQSFDFKTLPRRARPKFVQNIFSFQQRSFDHNDGLLLFDRQTGIQKIIDALRRPSKKKFLLKFSHFVAEKTLRTSPRKRRFFISQTFFDDEGRRIKKSGPFCVQSGVGKCDVCLFLLRRVNTQRVFSLGEMGSFFLLPPKIRKAMSDIIMGY